ncbi:hypothetical protein AOCH_007499, partial [Aspergillus ochraceoroseus]
LHQLRIRTHRSPFATTTTRRHKHHHTSSSSSSSNNDDDDDDDNNSTTSTSSNGNDRSSSPQPIIHLTTRTSPLDLAQRQRQVASPARCPPHPHAPRLARRNLVPRARAAPTPRLCVPLYIRRLARCVHLATEGYAGGPGDAASTSRGPSEVNSVSLPALRLSIASRLHYQFQTGLPKEFLMDVAAERNRVALPGATRGFEQQQQQKQQQQQQVNRAAASQSQSQSVLMGGMRLPPERFCLTGMGWKMADEWDSEGEEEVMEEDEEEGGEAGEGEDGDSKANVTGVGGGAGEGDEDEDEDGKMEDIFGEDAVMGDGDADGDGDKDMTDV